MTVTHDTVGGRARPVHYHTTDEIYALVLAFEHTSLPYPQWTHAAHLTVGLWYRLWYGPEEAVGRMRTGLKRYNAAHADEPMRVGYHETITRFWLWVIDEHVRATANPGSIAHLANGLIAARVDRELPFQYYSREHLLSDTARAEWVEPDRRALRARTR